MNPPVPASFMALYHGFIIWPSSYCYNQVVFLLEFCRFNELFIINVTAVKFPKYLPPVHIDNN